MSAGNITGSTTLHVIPGDAVASELMVVDAPEMFMAGESYELVFERRMPTVHRLCLTLIHAVSASSGGLSVDDDARVFWNPSATGPAVITGVDGTVSSSLQLDVSTVGAIDIGFQISPREPALATKSFSNSWRRM